MMRLISCIRLPSSAFIAQLNTLVIFFIALKSPQPRPCPFHRSQKPGPSPIPPTTDPKVEGWPADPVYDRKTRLASPPP